MKTVKQYRCMLVYAVLAAMAMTVLSAAMAAAAYDQDDQQGQPQQQNQSYQQQRMQQQSRQQGQQQRMQGRNQQIEQQVAQRLRQQGFGEQGQILILATGNRVILLGTVPDQNQRQQAQQIARQVSGVQQVDNRLQVRREARRMNDTQLEQNIQQQLPEELAQDVQVQVQSGRITLQGQVQSWQDLADAIEAAFAAGAQQVTSRVTVTGRDQFAMQRGQEQWRQQDRYGIQQGREDDQTGYYPPYGYGPDEQDQTWQQDRMGGRQQMMGRQQQMSATDRRLAQQVTQQLQQQLPEGQNVEVIEPQSIYVMVRQGTVMLHGFVQDRNQKQQAEQVVRSIRGVRNVRNDLQIIGDQGAARQGYGQRGQQQMTATDRRLMQQIQQELQDQMPDANIQVMVSQGTVTLRGSVQDNNQKQEAEQIVQNIRGVQDVQNDLTVGGAAGDYQPYGYVPGQEDQTRQGMGRQQMNAADRNLSQRIQQQIQNQLPGANIHVSISQGTATLHGSVQDNSQKQQAEQIARNIPGVQDVQNNITVSGQGMSQTRGQQQQQQAMGRGGQQQAMGQQASASDRNLAQQVAQQLKQQLPDIQNVQVMEPDTIYVMVSQGTVMLHGSVQEQGLEQQVEQIARNVQGVQDVQSDLSISGAAGFFPPLGYTPGQEEQTQQMDATGISGDQQCIQMLKLGVTDNNLQDIARDVYVTCHEGKFALYGYVRSDDEKDQLEDLTKEIPGVTEVDNNLIVREEGVEQKSDAELKEDVESQLWWSPFVDSDKIEVTVQNGTVTLSGEADDWDAMRAAVKNAFDAGARRVRSKIQYGEESGQAAATGQARGQRSGNQGSGTY